MTEREDLAEPEDVTCTDTATAQPLSEGQDRLLHEQDRLHHEFERLAGALRPFLTKQYHDTERRMRVLETRLRNRQERPLIVLMARLLADVRRLESGEDIKVHVQEAIVQALNSLGYQEMGSVGDQFDPDWHEPVSGLVGRAGIVTRVHRRGLACYGDVIIKAKVDVEPAPAAETDQGELAI